MFNTNTVNDRITAFTDLAALRHASYRALSALDSEKPEVKFLAPGLLFVTMAQQLGRNPHEDIVPLRRIIRAAEGPFTEQVQALRDYVRGEMLA